nr:endonuclease [Vibrio crassostreae]
MATFPAIAYAEGNTTIASFSKAKRILQKEIYNKNNDMRTIYCEALFDDKKNITLPDGYKTDKYRSRLKKYETEHVLPAENFGRTFSEWREGHPKCINSKGKLFKGRRCAEKVNLDYRLMQSDLYNLYPSIGATNAARQNYNFTMLPQAKSSFGSCDMRIEDRKVQPPEHSRGKIARVYMYFEQAYSRYSMSDSQRKLMSAWDKQYPVTDFECRRTALIEEKQGNTNVVVKSRCVEANMNYF